MDDATLTQTILKQSLFDTLPEQQRHAILSNSNVIEYHDGEIIIEQNTLGQECFLLLDGQVTILAQTHQDKTTAIVTLNTGSPFGESVFFSKKKRNATVKAKGTVKALKIPANAVQYIIDSKENCGAFFHNLAEKLFTIENRMNASLAEKSQLLKKLSVEFCLTVCYLAFYAYFISIIDPFALKTIHASLVTSVYAFGFTCLLLLRYQRLSNNEKQDHKINFNHFWPDLKSSLVILIFLLVASIAIKFSYHTWILGQHNFTLFAPAKNLFSSVYGYTINNHWLNILAAIAVTFIAGVCHQFIISEAIQNSLAGIFSFTHKNPICILISPLIYFSVQSHYGNLFPAIGFLSSIVWCALYFRHRCIWGICICQGIFLVSLLYLIGVG